MKDEQPTARDVEDFRAGMKRLYATELHPKINALCDAALRGIGAGEPVAANDPQILTAINQAWADRCGISYDDERAEEPHLYGWPREYKIYRDGWDAACLYAHAAPAADAVAVPEGWKLMPMEPTEAMLDAFDTAPHSENCRQDVVNGYRAMLAAAPGAAPTAAGGAK